MPWPRWLNSAPNTAHMTRQVSAGFSIAPGYAQHAAAVFQLEVAGDKILQQVAVLPEPSKGVFQILHSLSSIFFKILELLLGEGVCSLSLALVLCAHRSQATAR